MAVALLDIEDITKLESVLIGSDGLIRPVPSRELKYFSQNQLSLFCWKYGIYQLPTTELIDWLKREIGGRHAIEIGAGAGHIGTAVGIPITDSRIQETPEIAKILFLNQQPTVKYHPDIIHLDGNTAVAEMKPDVVLACWVTNKWKPSMTDGFVYGIDESDICQQVREYIHIGNDKTHASREVLSRYRFTTLRFPWLMSRSMSPKLNCITIYKAPKK